MRDAGRTAVSARPATQSRSNRPLAWMLVASAVVSSTVVVASPPVEVAAAEPTPCVVDVVIALDQSAHGAFYDPVGRRFDFASALIDELAQRDDVRVGVVGYDSSYRVSHELVASAEVGALSAAVAAAEGDRGTGQPNLAQAKYGVLAALGSVTEETAGGAYGVFLGPPPTDRYDGESEDETIATVSLAEQGVRSRWVMPTDAAEFPLGTIPDSLSAMASDEGTEVFERNASVAEVAASIPPGDRSGAPGSACGTEWFEDSPRLVGGGEIFWPAGVDVTVDGLSAVVVEAGDAGQRIVTLHRSQSGLGLYRRLISELPEGDTVTEVRISGDGSKVAAIISETSSGGDDASLRVFDAFDRVGSDLDRRFGLDWLIPERLEGLEIDAAGRFVTFSGRVDATNASVHDFAVDDADEVCNPGLCDTDDDVYVLDVVDNETTMITGSVDGVASDQPTISDDGNWVAFSSNGNFDDRSDHSATGRDVFVVDRADRSSFERISVTPDDELAVTADQAPGRSVRPRLSHDGRFVAYVSDAASLVDETWSGFGVFVHDRDRDDDAVFDEVGETTTTRASAVSADRPDWPGISDDGLTVSWVADTAAGSELVVVERDSLVAQQITAFEYARATPLASDAAPIARLSNNGGSYALHGRDSNGTPRVFFGDLTRPGRFSQMPPGAGLGNYPSRPTVADPVNTATGALVMDATDLPAPGGTPELRLTRSYNSTRLTEGVLGIGWVTNWDARVETSGTSVTFVDAHGRPFEFVPDGADWLRPDELRAELEVADDGFTIAWHNGQDWHFDTGGNLTVIENWDGTTTTITRTPDGLIEQIVASTGATMTWSYIVDSDGEPRVASIGLTDGRTVTYSYDESHPLTGGVLALVDNPDGTTTYEHDESARITSELSDGVTAHVTTYDTRGRVVRQQLSTGEVTEFVYDDTALTTEVIDTTSGDVSTYAFGETGELVSITDPMGNQTTATWSADGQPLGSTDRLGHSPSATYDERGNLTSVTDPVRGTTIYVYDSLNRVVSVTEPTGATTTMSYEGVERLPASVTDALGASTTFDVVDGLVVSVTDPDGVTVTYGYDAQRRMTSMTNGLGDTWTYGYDAVGRRTSETTPLGHVTSHTFDDAGRMLTSTAADGGTTTYNYDADGRVLSVADPVGAVTSNTYDPVTGLLATTTDPVGRVTNYSYNALGELTSVTANDGAVSETDYGTLGRVTATRDPLGREITYAYDANGNPTEVIAPDGGVSKTEYDPAGRITALEDPLGRRTSHAYDEFGRLSTVTAADGTTTSYTYDLLGRQVTVVAPDGGVSSTGYTPAGRTSSITDAEGGVTSYGYDLAGRLNQITDPVGHTTTVDFDADGRRIAVTTPEGLVTTWAYDPVGRITEIIDPSGVSMTRTYTLRGEVETEQRSGDGVVAYTYNLDGTLNTVTDAVGNTTTMTYDAAGRRATRIDATGAVESWTYNAAGEVVAQTDRLGNTTTIGYDPAGRIANVADPSGRTTSHTYNQAGELVDRTFGDGSNVSYAYDAVGRRTSMTDPAGTTTYTYDPAGRPTTITSPQGTLGYAYDLAGRRTGLTYPDGTTASYSYDPAGRLTAVTDPTVGTVSYDLDEDGRLTRTNLPDGQTREFGYTNGQLTSHTDLGRTTTIGYDDSGRISTLAGADNHTYTYDNAGQLLQAVQDNGTFNYTYGPRGEITSITDPERTRTFTHNPNAEIDTITGPDGAVGDATYDATGRMTELVDPDGTTTTYTYDARGLLVEITTTTPGDGDTGDGGGTETPDLCNGLTPTIVGTDGDDVLTGNWQDDIIVGLGGNDTINGGGGNDIICAGDGNNQINGGDGNDTITAGPGDDIIDGGNGTDQIWAGDGNNQVDGGHLNDTIHTGNGHDTIEGGTGVDIIHAGAGNDTIHGGDSDDTIHGGAGDDTIDAYNGHDTITGGTGNDSITGGHGDDTINAGPGNDHLDGGSGHDQLWGDTDQDTIIGGWGTDACEPEPTRTGCETDLTTPPVDAPAENPGSASETIVENRTYNGDGALTQVGVTTPDGVTTDDLHWDPTMAIPQIVTWTNGTGTADNITYGYQREAIAGTATSYNTLGDQNPTNGNWSPHGPLTTASTPVFGYRAELETHTSVHLRARELNGLIGQFITPDPLPGVRATSTYTNPYHYGNNDPVNLVDPLGLRPGDFEFYFEVVTPSVTTTTTIPTGTTTVPPSAAVNPYPLLAGAGIFGGPVDSQSYASELARYCDAGNCVSTSSAFSNYANGIFDQIVTSKIDFAQAFIDDPTGVALSTLEASIRTVSKDSAYMAQQATSRIDCVNGSGWAYCLGRDTGLGIEIAIGVRLARARTGGQGATGLSDEVVASSRWSRTEFGGNRVYQRSDLIDPNLVDDIGRTNLHRMQNGLAPVGPDGRSLQLHHMTQRQNGAIAEITATMHQQNSRVLHINPNNIPSGINRSAFDVWRADYWTWRAKDFE